MAPRRRRVVRETRMTIDRDLAAEHAIVVAERPTAGDPAQYQFPKFERQELPNGMGLISVHLPGRELVTASLVIGLGAVDEPSELAGISSLMSRALTEGTRHHDAIALTEAGERLGASIHAESGWDGTSISVEVPGQRLSAALALAGEVAIEPTFPESDVARLRDERMNDLLQAKADPRRRADDAFVQTIYSAGSPYGRPSGGTEETVPRLDAAACGALHARRFDATRMTLVVGGDLEGIGGDIRDIAELRFGECSIKPNAERPTTPRIEAARRERIVRVVHRPGSVQTEIRVGHVGLPRRNPDYHAVSVMSAILGGLFNSRLNRKLREEKGYTYGAGAGFDMRRGAGPFAARCAVNTDVTVPAVQEIIAELVAMRSAPVTGDELRAARDYLVGVFPLRFETPPAVVGAIAGLVIQGLPMDELDRYRAAIDAVTAETVQAAAQEHIRPDELAIVLVGDADAILPGLEGADVGPITVDREELPGQAA